MRPLSGKQKVLVVIGILLVPFVAVHIQEMIFRHRAEQLLADMRSLMMRKANAAEVEAVFKRWNPNGNPCFGPSISSEGHPRAARGCNLEAEVERDDFDYNPARTANRWSRILWRALFVIGAGRQAVVHAHAQLEGNNVAYVSFHVHVCISFGPVGDDEHFPDMLFAGTASDPPLPLGRLWQGLALHPNYLIHEEHSEGDGSQDPTVYTDFGPHADPADIARLTNIDLSCLTRLVACRRPEDIMPQAAAQYALEQPQLAQMEKEHACGPAVVGLMARDAEYAGLVEVTGIDTIHPKGAATVFVTNVRMTKNLASSGDWQAGKTRSIEILRIGDTNAGSWVSLLPPEVHAGNRFIVLTFHLSNDPRLYADPCGIVPLNHANLELVRNAIGTNVPPPKP
jgi:hypothetical protein